MQTTSNKKAIFLLRFTLSLSSFMQCSTSRLLSCLIPNCCHKMECRPHQLFLCLYRNCLYTTRSISSSDTLTAKKILGQSCAIAVMLTFPVHVLTQFLWWGAHSLQDVAFVVQFLFVILTLLTLSRRPVKALFDEIHTFRFISWHGLLAILIILISFFWIIFCFVLEGACRMEI